MKQTPSHTERSIPLRRISAVAGSLLLAGVVIAALALAMSGAPAAAAVATPTAEWHVCPAGPPGCDFATVQEAVDAAGPGDVIKVAEGVYTDIHVREGMTQVVFITESVTVRGGYTTADWETPDRDAHPTTLDAGGQGRVAVIARDHGAVVTVTLESLRLTNGKAPAANGDGGGFYAEYSRPIITGCQLYDNSASRYGGGLSVWDADEALLRNSEIFSNSAKQGGGVRLGGSDDVQVKGNLAYQNRAEEDGGGISIHSSDRPIVWGNVMHDNAALDGAGGAIRLGYVGEGLVGQNHVFGNVAHGNGGGMAALTEVPGLSVVENDFRNNRSDTGIGGGALLSGATDAMVRDNRFTHNEANRGGGIGFGTVAPATVAGNLFYSNTVSAYGGAAWIYNSRPFTMVNNVIADNEAAARGSGLYLYGSSAGGSAAKLVHNTFAGNHHGPWGEGIFVFEYSTLTLTNNIVAGHQTGLYAQNDAGSAILADHTLFYDNDFPPFGQDITSTNAMTGQDPRFADPSAWDYRILGDSAAIDAGIPVPWLATDVDGDSRPSGDGYDVGADEAGPVLALTKSGPEWANPGTEITYDLRLTNLGALPASTVTLTDSLPAGSHFLAATGGGTASDGIVAWAGLHVAPRGGAVTRTFVVTATETITNDDYRASAEGVQVVAGTPAVRTNRNHAPEADAGPDQTVDPLALVTLDGGGSIDPDGHAMTAHWTQIGGDSVGLNNSCAISSTFNAPGTLGDLAFKLVLTDVHGLSDSDTTVVKVGEESFVYLPLVVRQAP